MSRYWRVIFGPTGSVLDVVPIDFGDQQTDWVIVEAIDAQGAKRKAINFYCARKKKLAKERLRASGHCACGRKQDRRHPDGHWMLTCMVCAERSKKQSRGSLDRKARPPEAPHVRDEAARVAANMSRQRDRRAEIRIEVLIEVRDRWVKSRNVGLFGKWLMSEIEALTGKSAAA